jgi:hypothetical protein
MAAAQRFFRDYQRRKTIDNETSGAMRLKVASLATIVLLFNVAKGAERTISVAEYRDKVYGAWIGQIIGAS